MLKIGFGAAKVNKYASRESGDTLEIVERPVGMGGLTAILVDGQGSGRSAKALSNFVAGHCATLVKQGARDGVVARAANDLLYNHRQGQVSASLNLVSADLATGTAVVSRNNPQPVYVRYRPEAVQRGDEQPSPTSEPEFITIALDEPSVPLGIYPRTRPVIREFELAAGLVVVAFTDGIPAAGERYNGTRLAIGDFLRGYFERKDEAQPQSLADELLELALAADRHRPQDDMSVVVLSVSRLEVEDGAPVPRRMSVEIAGFL